ncbi:MAG: DUF3108 domain-containing protein [Bacteroidota bacterium]|nr:DUF3108 domain-containing protein [Bacteroidota bacterium]
MRATVVTILFFVFISPWFCNCFGQTPLSKIPAPPPGGKAFQSGEVLYYEVYYNWGLIWVDAGFVTFSVKDEVINNRTLYHFIGEGSSKRNWDWFFKVRDKYESYNDTSSLHPFKYIRNSNDGGYWVYNDIMFDFKNNRAIGKLKTKKNPTFQTDTIKISNSTFDPISMIYYARTIDYEKYKPNDEIPISIILDNEVHSVKITFHGKETIKTGLGTFKCIKFKPTLIAGTIFKEGSAMTVWVTDDDNRIPIKVETPIITGTIKVYLKKASGFKYKVSSKVE